MSISSPSKQLTVSQPDIVKVLVMFYIAKKYIEVFESGDGGVETAYVVIIKRYSSI